MTPHRYFITALISLSVATGSGATFSIMAVDEISSLLDAQQASATVTVSAKETATLPPQAVSLTAGDMVTKVYGVIDPSAGKKACVQQARMLLGLTPQEDAGVLWLETDNGYVVDYYGLRPQCSAMARYDDRTGKSGVVDYCYFFLFPYTSGSKTRSIDSQSEFCGTLLQELYDNGLVMDLNTATDDLFEAVGEHNGSLVDIRLLDDRQDAGAGRFILIVSIEPNVF